MKRIGKSRTRFALLARSALCAAALFVLSAPAALPARAAQPDWKAVDAETLAHFQALVRMNTTDPPGNEQPTSDYLVKVLSAAGIPVETFTKAEHRSNVVARLKGSGKKRPLLIMGHQDTVNVDPSKWHFPPFSAERDGGWIYGRGTIDDKDNVTAGLMTMLLLKRLNVPLDRDVIFLSEVGEEGSSQYGIQYMVSDHFDKIDSEYCFAEGAEAIRVNGKVKYAAVQTMEKLPRVIAVTANGISGHGSIPLRSNAIAHLSKAIVAIANWQAPIDLNDTTTAYFERLAGISAPDDAARYRALLKPKSKEAETALDYLLANEPKRAAMLHTTVSPNMIDGGYRSNVIPSEAKAQLDVRLMPDADPQVLLESLRKVVNDPAVTVDWVPRNERPGSVGRLDTEAYKVLEVSLRDAYKAPVLPVLGTGATDMAYLRPKGIQCYGLSVGLDEEDGPKGYGMHSDQERVLESELYRFVHVEWDVISRLARAR